MVSSSPAFKTTVSPFRLNDGIPSIPFHRRGNGRLSEPGQRQRSDGNYSTEYAAKYRGTTAPGLKSDDGRSVDIKPHSLSIAKADPRPMSPMASPTAGLNGEAAGKKLQGEARHPQFPARESPWAENEFKRVKDAFDKDRTHISYGIVQPRTDPLNQSDFSEQRAMRWSMRMKTPQPPVQQYDLTGVFHTEPVRRYYTMNQMFYSWTEPHASTDRGSDAARPMATIYQYSLNPTRPKSGLQ